MEVRVKSLILTRAHLHNRCSVFVKFMDKCKKTVLLNPFVSPANRAFSKVFLCSFPHCLLPTPSEYASLH